MQETLEMINKFIKNLSENEPIDFELTIKGAEAVKFYVEINLDKEKAQIDAAYNKGINDEHYGWAKKGQYYKQTFTSSP